MSRTSLFKPLPVAVSALLVAATASMGLRASPQDPEPKYSAAVRVLVDHLGRLQIATDLGEVFEEMEAEASGAPIESDPRKPQAYFSTPELLVGTMNDFMARGWCPERDIPGYTRSACLKENLAKLAALAYEEGAIDSVERAIYVHFSDGFTFRDDGSFAVDTKMLWRLGNPKRAPKRNFTDLPPLLEYRFKKLKLAEMRKERAEKNGLRSEGGIDEDLRRLLSQHYRKKIRGVGLVDSLDYATAKFSRLQLGELSRAMSEQIWWLQADAKVVGKIGEETREKSLTPDEVYAFVLNDLQVSFERKLDDETSYFYGFRQKITLEDFVLASILTGEMNEKWVASILAFPEFRQPKPDYAKARSFVGELARTLMILKPELLTFYTVGSIVVDSVRRNRDDRKDFNNETRRILIRDIR